MNSKVKKVCPSIDISGALVTQPRSRYIVLKYEVAFTNDTISVLMQGANTIRSIEGLDRLGHLTKLHLRDNQIDNLDGFSSEMKNLQYLNLRQVDSLCHAVSMNQIYICIYIACLRPLSEQLTHLTLTSSGTYYF